MKLDDILTLSRAGFTAAQISQLAELEDGSHPGQPEQPEQPAPQPDPQPTPQPDPQPTPQPAPDPIAAVMAEITKLREQIQQNNRAGAQQPPDPQVLTGDQILANVIRPARKGG